MKGRARDTVGFRERIYLCRSITLVVVPCNAHRSFLVDQSNVFCFFWGVGQVRFMVPWVIDETLN